MQPNRVANPAHSPLRVRRFARGLVNERFSVTASRVRPSTRLFFFFSNTLGCLPSLLISAVATVVLLLVLGVLD